MYDYIIKSDSSGGLGVVAKTERAKNRAIGPPIDSTPTLWFRTRTDGLKFIAVAEADGFTFAEKDLLG
jgi:hypothetical protein